MDRRLAALGGAALVLVALVLIWGARLTVPRELYVSELGADGEPTAAVFQVALLLIVAGAGLIAWSARHLRSRAAVLRAWSPAVSLWIACLFFLVSAQVPCTSGCPVPYGPDFTWQDFTHTSAAVLAFAAACWAMFQCAFVVARPLLARFSLAASLTVALIAGAGGLMSLFRWYDELGSRFELVATTIGLLWILGLGSWIAAGERGAAGSRARAAPSWRRGAASATQGGEQLVGE